MKIQTHKELEVYQRGMSAAMEIYGLVQRQVTLTVTVIIWPVYEGVPSRPLCVLCGA